MFCLEPSCTQPQLTCGLLAAFLLVSYCQSNWLKLCGFGLKKYKDKSVPVTGRGGA
jgi:hypothetical protein